MSQSAQLRSRTAFSPPLIADPLGSAVLSGHHSCPPVCSEAATISSRMAHDLDDLCRTRDGSAVFPSDLVERGYAQETVDLYGAAAVRMASRLRETREADGRSCCRARDIAVTQAPKRLNAAMACALTAAAVAGGAAIVARTAPTHSAMKPVTWAGAIR